MANHFLAKAAKELNVETKALAKTTASKLSELMWPGNVRQLENTCRWLTVMASGQEILPNDLPPELTAVIEDYDTPTQEQDWTSMLGAWANKQLSLNKVNILDEAQIEFERVLLNCALKHTQGHKQDAAKKLGWGRNTLTRKLKELKMED